jgi:hypothetical protein
MSLCADVAKSDVSVEIAANCSSVKELIWLESIVSSSLLTVGVVTSVGLPLRPKTNPNAITITAIAIIEIIFLFIFNHSLLD